MNEHELTNEPPTEPHATETQQHLSSQLKLPFFIKYMVDNRGGVYFSTAHSVS